jgi:hypothetical protein
MTSISNNKVSVMRIAEVCVLSVLMLLRKQPAHGAHTTLYAATAPELRKSATEGGGIWGGQYITNCLPKVTCNQYTETYYQYHDTIDNTLKCSCISHQGTC